MGSSSGWRANSARNASSPVGDAWAAVASRTSISRNRQPSTRRSRSGVRTVPAGNEEAPSGLTSPVASTMPGRA